MCSETWTWTGRCAPQRATHPRPCRGRRLLRAHAGNVEPADIGLPQQGWLLELWDERDLEVPILDAGDFLRAPESHLRWLCDWLGIRFTDRMLSWPPGPRVSDGVWAPHWYASVQSSTGFAPWRPREINLSEHDAAVAEVCRPVYEELYGRRVRV